MVDEIAYESMSAALSARRGMLAPARGKVNEPGTPI